MKEYLCAFSMCQSMFCAIPFPARLWDEKARSKMLLFLPLIGLEIGAVWAALAWVCSALELPATVRGILLCACPFLLTGFIHLDGFMDVTDALGSWRELERRREILKDSHVGSFAVIGIVLLSLCQFALFSAAPETADHRILIFIPAVSRCCSALAVTGLKPMSTSQYAKKTTSPGRMAVLWLMLASLICLGFLLCGLYGIALLACVAGYGIYLRKGYRMLEGMNGDISGYCITISELWAVAVYALLEGGLAWF